MSFGALAFLNPWLLAGLVSLPLIYWLLRTVPPRPKQVEFPPTRILVGIENVEKTPAKTPWWLMLIRLLAAALVIFALAEPVLNPTRESALSGSGPVVLVIDNGWAGASHWGERIAAAERLIDAAEGQGRAVIVAPTAPRAKTASVKIEAPATARSTLAALLPQPHAPDRAQLLGALESVLANAKGGTSVVWLADGIDHAAASKGFAEGLAKIASGGSFALLGDTAGREPVGVAATSGAGGRLEARVLRAEGPSRNGQVHAFSARGERIGEAAYNLAQGQASATAVFDMPLELRNQVTRVEIAGERSAGAVSLIDARAQWHRVGLISGERQEESQPLLAPLYYIEKALAPYAEIVKSKDANLAAGIESILKQNATVLVLADIGTLSGDMAARVESWVKRGGVLVRFAGPRLEKGGDDLLPVPLRLGGRTLGGALSWSTPQPLAAFDEKGPFAGFPVPADVTVSRQVLADPQRLGPEVAVWARLADGTPLVTARREGEGQIVLFHVTANSEWSNLPLSGVFVDMLRRLSTLGRIGAPPSGDAATATSTTSADAASAGPTADVLTPLRVLDGFGKLVAPPPTAEPISAARLANAKASLAHPPGFYGPEASPRALNVLHEDATLAPLPPLPAGVKRIGYETDPARALKPGLLTAALGLIFADILAVVLLSLGGLAHFRRRAGHAASLLLIAVALLAFSAPVTLAQRAPATPPAASTGNDQVALQATGKVTFGYVLTGNAATDDTSKQGLSGLGRVLGARTAVTPGEPLPVDILNDEIAFYPVLYWPVLPDADPLPEPTLAKIDAYMKQGGMIVFDTRDYGSGAGATLGGRDSAIQRIIGRLDIPRLEPVPEGHVLTKSFYLLRTFPGRWDGGQLWVEADAANHGGDDSGRQARRADGVTSIVITSNDLASAWALDERGRPLYPVVPGGENQREMAFRTGVNLVMHALTGNYKADQVHVPALLERLGQ